MPANSCSENGVNSEWSEHRGRVVEGWGELRRDAGGVTRGNVETAGACQNNMETYLSETEPSPYSFVVQLQHLGTSLGHNQHPPPNITWNPDFTEVSIHNKGKLSLTKYRLGLEVAVDELEEFLLTTLLRGHEPPLHITDNVMNDLPNTPPGYGWVDNLPHMDILEVKPLLACFFSEASSPFKLPTADRRFQFLTVAVHKWLGNYDTMSHMFTCLTQTTLSAPPCGTELVDSKILNTSTRMRNLEFMFPIAGEWATSEQFGHTLKHFTKRYWDIELSIRDEHHLAVTLKCEFIRDINLSHDDPSDLASGHTTATTHISYQRLGEATIYPDGRHVGAMDLSKLIQSAVGLAMQTHMASIHSEVKGAIAVGIVELSLALRHQVWDDVQLGSNSGGQPIGVFLESEPLSPPCPPPVPPLPKYTLAVLLQLLRQALDEPRTQFTSHTERSMLQLTADTGAGKSLVWVILPNTNEQDKTTLVVTPYFTLVADQIDTRRKLGRSEGKWTAKQTQEWSAGSPRVVYVIPEAMDSARDQFAESLGCTCRPHCPATHVADFMARVSLEASTPILSAPTESPNHSLYNIRLGENKRDEWHILQDMTMRLMIDVLASVSCGSHGIIFVPFRTICVDLANHLDYPFYHGELTQEEKGHTLTQWKNGQTSLWIVATTTLQNGVHIRSIPAIVFWGPPHNAISFGQALGWGGCDGNPCTDYVFSHSKDPGARLLSVPPDDAEGVGQMDTWLKTPLGKCLQLQLSKWFDGAAQDGISLTRWRKYGHCDPSSQFACYARDALKANPKRPLNHGAVDFVPVLQAYLNAYVPNGCVTASVYDFVDAYKQIAIDLPSPQ
ncbi:hypothetical protein JB92DRAFT_2832091 [Gautieria morchelliformis]|nr:hypothetical protein JB92DRAFT_2832091 [Gautieria morchelliformis]